MNYVQKEMKDCFHSKSTGLLLFALLVFCLITAGNCFLPGQASEEEEKSGEQTAPFQLGVVDREQDTYTEILLRYFAEDDAFASYVNVQVGEENEIRNLFEKGELDGWVQIPESFVTGMIELEHVPLQITLSGEDTAKEILLRNLFQAYGHYVTAVETGCMTLYRQMEEGGSSEEQLERANVRISLELILTALGRTDFFEYESVTGSREKTMPLPVYYAFSFLGLLPFLMAVPAGLRLTEERRNGIYRRIRASGGSIRWFMARLAVCGSITALHMLAAGSLLRMELGYPQQDIRRMLTACLLCFGITGGMMAASFAVQDRREYLLAAGMTVLLLALFGGSFLPVRFLPNAMEQLADWLPNRILAKIWMKG